MNIALLGYGKMGHAIEEIAIQKGHNIVCKVGIENLEDRTRENIVKYFFILIYLFDQQTIK